MRTNHHDRPPEGEPGSSGFVRFGQVLRGRSTDWIDAWFLFCFLTPLLLLLLSQSDLFQDDLYPDTAGPEAALEAEEWFEGKNADPLLISLKHGYIPGKNRDLKVVRKNILDNKPAANKKSDLINTPKKAMDTSNPVSNLPSPTHPSAPQKILLVQIHPFLSASASLSQAGLGASLILPLPILGSSHPHFRTDSLSLSLCRSKTKPNWKKS